MNTCPKPCRLYRMLAAGAVVMAAFPQTPVARATTRSWTDNGGLGGGSWAGALNWSPTGVPQNGDDVTISGSNVVTESVTYDYTAGSAITLSSLTITRGNTAVTSNAAILNMTANTLTASFETVGDSSAGGSRGHGFINQSGGTHTALNSLILGVDALDFGTYNFTGGAFNSSGLFVGQAGFGVFNQSGGTATISNFVASNPLLEIGALGGNGTYNLSSGSLLIHNAQISVGAIGNGTFNQTGGINAPTGGGTSTFNIGYTHTSNGAYLLSGGTVTATTIYLGIDGNGSINHSAGLLTLSPAAATQPTMTLGYFSDGIGAYDLSGSAALLSNNGQEIIGGAGIGTFTQSAGSNTLSSNGLTQLLIVAQNPGSAGTYNLSGGALTVNNAHEIVGFSGTGTFNQSGGTNTITSNNGSGGSLIIAQSPGSVGTYSLSGGSLSAKNIYVGGDNNGPGGTGTFTLNTLNTLSVSNAITVYSGGTLNGTGSSSSAVNLLGGTISPGNSPDNPSATLTLGSLTVNSTSKFIFDTGDLLAVSNTNGLALSGAASVDLQGLFSSGTPIISYAGALSGPVSNLSFFGGSVGSTYSAVNVSASHVISVVATTISRNDQIAVTDQPSPIGGTFARGVSTAVVDNNDHVGLEASYADGRIGYLRYDGTSFTVIATVPQPAPGMGGGNFNVDINGQGTLNALGQSTFEFTLDSTIDGSTIGVFRGDGVSLVPIVRDLQPLPGGGGEVFAPVPFGASAFFQYSNLNNSGQIAFDALVNNSPSNSASGIFRGDGSTITTIVRDKQAAPGPGGGNFNYTFGPQAGSFFEPSINSSGQVAFTAVINNSTSGSGVFRGDGVSLIAIARSGQAAPGAGGGVFSNTPGSFSEFVINDAGQVAFDSFLSNTTDGATAGLYRGDGATTIVLARDKRSAPGAGGGTFNGGYSHPAINAAGQVAFFAGLTGTTDGGIAGYFRSDGSSIVALARDKQIAPFSGGAAFDFSNNNSFFVINAGGQVAFPVELSGTPDGLSSNTAIYISDGQDLLPVVISGQTINTSFGPKLVLPQILIGNLNDYGQLVWAAGFFGGTTGYFLYTPTLHWRSTSSGAWDTNTNWTLSLNPAYVHDVIFDPATSLAVTGPASPTLIRSLTMGGTGATPTIKLSSGSLKLSDSLTIIHSNVGVYTAKLDLATSKLILQSSGPADKSAKIAGLNAAITAGANGTTWTGIGITSSSAALDPNHYGVGVFDNALLNLTSFGGQSADTNSILTAIAHLGDANRNNIVDIQDLTIVANNWQQSRNNWAAGDLNRDGIVDIQDFTIVANNWQQTSSFPLAVTEPQPLAAAASVPEPASFACLAFAGLALLARRRARNIRDLRF